MVTFSHFVLSIISALVPPNPADGDIFTHFVLSILSTLVPGPTEKMTLLQSVTDALDIALTKVAQFCTMHSFRRSMFLA